VIEKSICGVKINVPDKLDSLLWADQELMARYWKVLHGDVCIDAGFGPGGWSLVALALGASVFAFDPRPYAVEILSQVLAVNSFPRCCVVQSGLWSCSAVRAFPDGPAPVIALDDFAEGIRMGRLDHINIDAEGAELEILRGARETIHKFHPRLIVEVHSDAWDAVEKELKALGDYAFERFQGFVIAAPHGGPRGN